MKNSQAELISAKKLCFAGVLTAVLVACSYLTVPFVIPFTMQIFAVCFIAQFLSVGYALLAVGCYILLGAIGVPVFSGFGSGMGYLLSPTGGFLVGFLAMVAIIGLLKKFDKNSFVLQVIISVAGLFSSYFFGTFWYMYKYLGVSFPSLITALSTCVLPFVAFDIIKVVLAVALSNRLKKQLNI